MTLKIYSKAEDIPEGLRGEYKQSGQQWVPDLSEDHPVILLNAELKREKGVEEAKVKKLRSDLDDALAANSTTGIPRGHVAVPKADADALAGFKALGKTPDELKTIATEHGTLKESETRRAREDKQRLVAKELGYDNVEAFLLLPDHPDYEIRDGKDGKKSVIALVKDGDKTVEKPAQEFLESSPRHAPLLSALKAKPGVTVHGTSSTTTSAQPGDPFAWAKSFAEDYSKSNVPTGNLHDAFYGVSKPTA